MITPQAQPIIFVVSAPSGAGKTTLCDKLKREFRPRLQGIVTITTRPPRSGEVEGESYRFFSESDFVLHAENGAFLEHALVHGYRYGTPRGTVGHALAGGRDVLLNVDVQGAASIREAVRAVPADDPLAVPLVDVFIVPPSRDVLRQRLVGRGQDSAEVIERRLQRAEAELACWREYRYLIINDDLATAYDQLRAIVLAERARIRKVK